MLGDNAPFRALVMACMSPYFWNVVSSSPLWVDLLLYMIYESDLNDKYQVVMSRVCFTVCFVHVCVFPRVVFLNNKLSEWVIHLLNFRTCFCANFAAKFSLFLFSIFFFSIFLFPPIHLKIRFIFSVICLIFFLFYEETLPGDHGASRKHLLKMHFPS